MQYHKKKRWNYKISQFSKQSSKFSFSTNRSKKKQMRFFLNMKLSYKEKKIISLYLGKIGAKKTIAIMHGNIVIADSQLERSVEEKKLVITKKNLYQRVESSSTL